MEKEQSKPVEMDNGRIETLRKAFRVVEDYSDWKAPINTSGTEATFNRVFKAMGITMDDVKEAVAFFTATTAEVSRSTVDGEVVITIKALGYRMGPAGDH